ncbi:hypothetical protein C0Q70_19069 [Pomacea canaliculata]|uniref:Uncharacterized protein n=1 Tax=Pomacea canaliculata TaxID=400727 RepID=A0A2T7NID1_POMCA|nr:hypothetical protein C0Q70_19069 [Pomacea canaliculata]
MVCSLCGLGDDHSLMTGQPEQSAAQDVAGVCLCEGSCTVYMYSSRAFPAGGSVDTTYPCA